MLAVQGFGDSHGVGQGGFAFQCKIGEDVLHQRLFAESPTEGAAVAAMVGRLGQCLAHAGGAADHAVEAGHGDHFNDRRYTSAFLAHHPRQGAAQFRFAGGVGDIAHLVFQALDLPGVFAAVRAPAWHQEAGQAASGLGQHQEGVAHGGRYKPFVADQFIGLPRAFCTDGVSTSRVGPDVAATLFFRHCHADGDGLFFAVRQVSGVVAIGEDFVFPGRGQFRLFAD